LASSTKTDFYIDNINIKKSKVHSLLTDSSNNLWIGIYQKGVAFIPSQANMFNYIGNFSSIRNYIGSNCITALCETTDKGKLIVGTDNDGIYLLDKNYNFIQHLTQDKNPDVPPTVMCLFEDSNKKVWIGSYLSGISVFDSQTNKLSKTSLRNNEGNEITKVYRFVEDPHKRLWIGTMGTGLYYVDLPASSASYSDLKVHQALSEKEINQWINTLLYIPNGRLYIGTYDGFNCIDTEKLIVVG
jgi:ligand-binding sensor domain-containing protein